MNEPTKGICFFFLVLASEEHGLSKPVFQQKCEVIYEGHTVPWLLTFSVSPEQVPVVLGKEGCHTASLSYIYYIFWILSESRWILQEDAEESLCRWVARG